MKYYRTPVEGNVATATSELTTYVRKEPGWAASRLAVERERVDRVMLGVFARSKREGIEPWVIAKRIFGYGSTRAKVICAEFKDANR